MVYPVNIKIVFTLVLLSEPLHEAVVHVLRLRLISVAFVKYFTDLINYVHSLQANTFRMHAGIL